MYSLRYRLPALACSATFLLCELISRPWAEMGISDDWSYIRTSQLLAQTGHIHYVGWSTPILGWQLYLSAAFIKLFGFSFTAARLPILLIALLTTYLVQRTLVRFGISERNAVLGTLTFVLSPLYMPLSATMMTDIPGFFSVLVCIYGCVRALQAIQDRDAIFWLCLAVAVNAICGTSRQIAWLGVLVLVPSTLFLLRSRKKVLLYGLIATALGYLFVFSTLHWFNIQPYMQPEPVKLAPFHIWAWKFVGRSYVKSSLEIGLLLFPLVVPYIAVQRSFSRKHLLGSTALIAFSVAFIYYLGQKAALLSLLSPFEYGWVSEYTVMKPWLPCEPPVILSPIALASLSVVALTGIFCVATTVLILRPGNIEPRPANALSRYQLAILFGPLDLVYLLLLSNRGLYLIDDRYLITPIFVAIVFLLLYSQRHLKVRWHAATGIAIATIAFYGIICTHNNFALARARIVLAKELFDAGVPHSNVDLGWEMNGWNELQVSTYLNDPRMVRPAGAYHAYIEPHYTGCHQSFSFELFPHLAARYGVSFDPNICDGPAPFTPVSYSTWPLLHPTTLYIVKYPPPWQSAIDMENHIPPATNR